MILSSALLILVQFLIFDPFSWPPFHQLFNKSRWVSSSRYSTMKNIGGRSMCQSLSDLYHVNDLVHISIKMQLTIFIQSATREIIPACFYISSTQFAYERQFFMLCRSNLESAREFLMAYVVCTKSRMACKYLLLGAHLLNGCHYWQGLESWNACLECYWQSPWAGALAWVRERT